jgi:hypothetical protein
MKPSWKDAPEWAQYLAQDTNGRWYWWEIEPVLRVNFGEGGWYARGRHELAGDTELPIEKRPEIPND